MSPEPRRTGRGFPGPARENPIVVRAADSDSTGALVITHPGALAAETYETLAKLLPATTSVYVYAIDRIPEYWEPETSPSALTLTDIAERFAGELFDEVGDLPYALLGWSFGGVVAYAVAEAATRVRGPEHLLLLDSIAPGGGDPGKDLGTVLPDREALDWFALYLGAKRGCPLGFGPADFTGVGVDEGLDLIVRRAVERGALYDGTTASGLRKAYETYVEGVLRNKRLHDGFRPSPPRWPVSLVRPARGLFDTVSRLGWDELVGDQLTVHRCTGDHYSMLSDPEPTAMLAGIVESALGRAGEAERMAAR